MTTAAPEANGVHRTKRERESSPEKPVALPVDADGIPAELKELCQWVVWRYVWKKNKKDAAKGEVDEDSHQPLQRPEVCRVRQPEDVGAI